MIVDCLTEPHKGRAANYRNHAFDERRVAIENIRGREKEFTLEKNGFEVVEHGLDYSDFDNEDNIKTIWWNMVAEMVKKRFGCGPP
jgi:hypothetical protein